MEDSHILNELKEGFERYEIPYFVTENIQDSAFVVKFNSADNGDCLLLIAAANKTLEVHKVTGPIVIRRPLDNREVNEDFFSMLRENYEAVKRLVMLRNGLHSALET